MNIVVGYIDTPEGNSALERGIAEAKLRGGRIVVVHSRKEGTDRQTDEIIRDREAVEAVEHRLQKEGVPFLVHDYVRGNTPAEDIIATAQEESAGLIVIGLRRRTPTGKYLLGSNAQDILLSAPCPVITVPSSSGL